MTVDTADPAANPSPAPAAEESPVATAETATLEVTSAKGWRRPLPPMPVELPSGNVPLLRKPQLLAMMKLGQIPNPLLELAVAAVNGGASTDFAKTAEFIDFLVSAAFVEPRVVLEGEPGEGELSIGEITDQDKTFVVNWTQRETRAVEPFRSERPSTPGSSDGGDVRDTPEPAPVA